ncbi:MAG: sigma-70 family RNA polymerase sigma factor [Cyclobacteriaceae bacterium]
MRVNLSGNEILKGLSSGDQQTENRCLKQLYQEYYGLIEIFILKNNGSPDDAKDVFQDGIIVLYNKSRQEDFILTSSVKTYLYSVCRNIWIDRLRQSINRSRLLDLHEFDKVQEDDLKVLLENERSAVLMEHIDRLGPKCKTVLTLFYYDRKSMKEIALKMDMASEAVARNKKHSCLSRLRDMVSENDFLKQLLYF